MPVEVISYLLSERDREQRLRSQLVLQCAPFLKGIKAAAITNLPSPAGEMLEKVLIGTGISHRVLAVRKDRCLVFLYRKVIFEQHISRRENVEFLAGFGYTEGSAEEMLKRLADRIWRTGSACMPAGSWSFPMRSAFSWITLWPMWKGLSGMLGEIICCQATGRCTMIRTEPGNCSGPMTGPGTAL